MIDSLSKTDDFIKMINSLRAHFFFKVINFDENHKIVNKNIKGVRSL